MYTYATKVQDNMGHLIHQTSLSIAISILSGVQLVHQTWLLASSIVDTSVGTSGTSASSSEVLIVMVAMSVAISLGQRSSSSSACAAKSAAN
jgi:hypothetical protein